MEKIVQKLIKELDVTVINTTVPLYKVNHPAIG